MCVARQPAATPPTVLPRRRAAGPRRARPLDSIRYSPRFSVARSPVSTTRPHRSCCQPRSNCRTLQYRRMNYSSRLCTHFARFRVARPHIPALKRADSQLLHLKYAYFLFFHFIYAIVYTHEYESELQFVLSSTTFSLFMCASHNRIIICITGKYSH